MKVLVLSHMYPSTFNEVAGIFVHEQVKALIEKDVEVRVVSPVPWTPFPINKLKQRWRGYSEISPKGTLEGVKIYYPRYPAIPRGNVVGASGYLMYAGIRKFVTEFYKVFRFNIMHAHAVFPDGVAGMLLANHITKKPLCITVHGSDVRMLSQNPLCKPQIVRALITSDAVISGHPEITQLVKHLGRSEVHEIPNGVDLEKFSPEISGDQVREELNIKNKHIVSFIANLNPFKDPETFIRSIPLVVKDRNDVRFCVVGDGVLRTYLEVLTQGLGVGKYVSFTGCRKDANLILAASDIFVALSPVENIWSTTILEAIAAGIPCIVTRAGTTEKYLAHERTAYLIEKKNPKVLAAAILYLLNNKEMREKLAQNGRDIAKQFFDIRRSARKIIELYHDNLR